MLIVKYERIGETMKVFTHDGRFHADECMAISIINLVHKTEVRVVRTRDLSDVKDDDFVIDVGFGELDHHQKGGNGIREHDDDKQRIPYASAGLCWKKYGMEIEGMTERMHRHIDNILIRHIDAVDTGFTKEFNPTSLNAIIGSMNTNWTEADHNQEEYFHHALSLTKRILIRHITNYMAIEKAIGLIEPLVTEAEYIILPHRMSWIEAVTSINETRKDPIKFIIFADTRDVKIQTVPKTCETRESYEDLPDWNADKPEGLVFCHIGRFIAGFDTVESAVKAITSR
jgi:uncharacterized UPF0160 family protein